MQTCVRASEAAECRVIAWNAVVPTAAVCRSVPRVVGDERTFVEVGSRGEAVPLVKAHGCERLRLLAASSVLHCVCAVPELVGKVSIQVHAFRVLAAVRSEAVRINEWHDGYANRLQEFLCGIEFRLSVKHLLPLPSPRYGRAIELLVCLTHHFEEVDEKLSA